MLEHGHIIEEGRPYELLQGDTALMKLFAQDPDRPQPNPWDEFYMSQLEQAQRTDEQSLDLAH